MKVYIKNKFVSLAGDATVTDENKNPVYKIKGKVISIKDKKFICDMEDKTLYVVKNKFSLFTHKSYVCDADEKPLCTVKGKVFSSKSFKLEGEGCNMKVDGKFFSPTSKIIRDDVVIGTIRRKFNLLVDSFELEAEEADLPFCIAIVVAINNIVKQRAKD